MEVLLPMRVWSRFLHLSGAAAHAKRDPFWEPFPAKIQKKGFKKSMQKSMPKKY
jgi:hypothetical protein